MKKVGKIGVDWVLDAISLYKDKIPSRGAIVSHNGGVSKLGTKIPAGLYIYDSPEKDDGKNDCDDWVSCYITKKVNSGFHFYVDIKDLSFVMSKDDAKKYNFDVNSTLH